MFSGTSSDHAPYWALFKQLRRKPNLREKLRSGALHALSATSKTPPGPWLRLVYCHYVFDDQVANFERQISYLFGIGSFLSTEEVLAVARGEKPLEQRCFHLSFDDGFRNVITNALPVLRKYNVPATFFVPTAIISADYPTVRDYCLKATNYPGVIEMASWDDLARALEQGLTIASHTRTHARFSDISQSETMLEDEIFGSKEDLERRLGQPCPYISWPYGSIRDADPRSLEFVKKAGYQACFGAFRGQVSPGNTDPYYIPRHHFEAHWPLSHLKYFISGGQEK